MGEASPRPSPPRNEAEYIAQFLIPASSFNMLRNLEEIVKVFLGWASITLEVFVRRDFGERYLTLGRIASGYVFILTVLGLSNLRLALILLPSADPTEPPATVSGWYILCFLLLSLVHLVHIFFRNRAGVAWYSRSHGLSWFDFLIPLSGYRISDWVLYRYIEPGICFLIAWFGMPLLLPGDGFTRNWLIFASLGLFFHNNLVYNTTRNHYLDLVDSEIVSRYFNELRESSRSRPLSIRQTAGYSVVPIPRVAQEMLPPDIAGTVQETLSGAQNRSPQD